MSFIKDFKAFAIKGNVIDLAVAVVIGTAFGKIVSSLVNDIIMPPAGLLMGDRFRELKIVLKQATESTAEVSLNYGMFIQNVVDFLFTAISIFLVIRAYQKLIRRRKEEEEAKPVLPPEPGNEEKLLREIRDLLKEKNNSPQ